MADIDIAQDILDYAGPNRISYAVLRVRGRESTLEDPPFSCSEIVSTTGDADGSNMEFTCAEDAINRLHAMGYMRLPDRDDERWSKLMRGGLERSDIGNTATETNVLAVFSKEAGGPPRGHTLLTANNLASAVADLAATEAERLVSRPQISIVYKMDSNFDPQMRGYTIHGLEDVSGSPDFVDGPRNRFENIEDALRILLEAGFQRLEEEQEERWKAKVNMLNRWVGPDGSYMARAGQIMAVFAR